MRTHDLITVLSRDAVRPAPWWQRPYLLLAGGALVSLTLFTLILDARGDLMASNGMVATAGKWSAALALLMLAGKAALELRQPQAQATFLRPLAIILAVLATGAIGLDLIINGTADLGARLMGSSAFPCLVFVTLFSLAPLAAFLVALRRGAVTSPDRAGLAAGLAAAGLAVAIYALHCNEDSPLFVTTWYGLASVLVGGLGVLSARLALRW